MASRWFNMRVYRNLKTTKRHQQETVEEVAPVVEEPPLFVEEVEVVEEVRTVAKKARRKKPASE